VTTDYSNGLGYGALR